MDSSVTDALRERGFALAVAVGILYSVFLIGWLFGRHLGLPASRLRGKWIVLILVPAVLAVMLFAEAVLPRWAMSLLIIAFLAFVVPWFRAHKAHAEQTDPLCGREGVIVVGHPADLRVRVDDEVWNAAAPEGHHLFDGDRVLVKRRQGVRLIVERRET